MLQLLDDALANPNHSKFINPTELKNYRGMGGVSCLSFVLFIIQLSTHCCIQVRIEDDVLITENGCENFTKVPRTVDAIEAYMKEHNEHVKNSVK
jgi:hypothetical protein